MEWNQYKSCMSLEKSRGGGRKYAEGGSDEGVMMENSSQKSQNAKPDQCSWYASDFVYPYAIVNKQMHDDSLNAVAISS